MSFFFLDFTFVILAHSFAQDNVVQIALKLKELFISLTSVFGRMFAGGRSGAELKIKPEFFYWVFKALPQPRLLTSVGGMVTQFQYSL